MSDVKLPGVPEEEVKSVTSDEGIYLNMTYLNLMVAPVKISFPLEVRIFLLGFHFSCPWRFRVYLGKSSTIFLSRLRISKNIK